MAIVKGLTEEIAFRVYIDQILNVLDNAMGAMDDESGIGYSPVVAEMLIGDISLILANITDLMRGEK